MSRERILANGGAFKPKPLQELDALWLKSGFGRRGGKANRKLQKQRILVFLSYCMSAWGLKSLGQLGRKHVENFFVSRWDLAPKTKSHYFYAIRVLWILLGKSELPPKPVIL